MTAAAKDLVLTKLKNTLWSKNSYKHEIDNIIKFIEQGPGSDGVDFLDKMQRTDAYRKQNFLTTHKDIAVAMGYNNE